MEEWWENLELREMQQKCDNAFDSQDVELLRKMSNNCVEKGQNDKLHSSIRASYLYSGATSLLGISIEELRKEDELEEIYERCLYLMRTAIDLCKKSYKDLLDKDEDDLQKAYLDGLFYPLHVNYANLLSQTGRYVKSINTLQSISNAKFPMAVGNLALKIVDYSYFDKSHQKIMLYEAYHSLSFVIKKDVSFPEKEYAGKNFELLHQRIENDLGLDYLNNNYDLDSFLAVEEDTSIDETNYRKWFSDNCLSLNQLNDIYMEKEVAYDPLHLPSMVTSIELGYMPKYHGIFNQIKQEYVSARFWIYEGLNESETHYSDRQVYLINTFDYPVYGIGIEKMKAAYRGIYSIFDKIAFFLNKYLNLGIPERQISFHTLWYRKEGRKEVRRENVVKFIEKNWGLNGLWWIYKDLKNKVVYKDKHIDPVLRKISKVRNAMEHKYLKISNDFFDVRESDRVDDFAYNISFDDFEDLTIALLQLTREAIIQLTIIVQQEEDNKYNNRDPDKTIGELYLYSYEDEWKQI
ncbi:MULTISPECIES: LA2681 family HEPN domain-containing protein [Listeria]|uniref:LA2681 family HEPN domain-containing protein n=1 Tax=Listeria TaxID=1637 RepID=UPI000B58F129|nr:MULTISPECIES: LA2681 family HEPN domain-containing protein [Listeria]